MQASGSVFTGSLARLPMEVSLAKRRPQTMLALFACVSWIRQVEAMTRKKLVFILVAVPAAFVVFTHAGWLTAREANRRCLSIVSEYLVRNKLSREKLTGPKNLTAEVGRIWPYFVKLGFREQFWTIYWGYSGEPQLKLACYIDIRGLESVAIWTIDSQSGTTQYQDTFYGHDLIPESYWH